jgi:hypothetical protein
MQDDDKPDLDDKPDVDLDDDTRDQDDDDTQDDKSDDKKPDDKGDLGSAGKKALDAMKRERNAAKKALADAQAKLKQYEDKDKTETERLAEAAEEAKSRASKAETTHRKLATAMDRAPDGATLAQIKAVAKRLSGDSEEELEADADELFALLAPKSDPDEDRTRPPAGRPKERLRGGGDPDDEPEEMNPRKLADLIGRP